MKIYSTNSKEIRKVIYKKASSPQASEILNLLVEVLPEKERRVLQLWFWHNKNFYEISVIERIRKSTAEKLLESGLNRLRHKKHSILKHINKEDNVRYRILNSDNDGEVIGFADRASDGFKIRILETKETYRLVYNITKKKYDVYKHSFDNRMIRKTGLGWPPEKDETHIKFQLSDSKDAFIDVFTKPYKPKEKTLRRAA